MRRLALALALALVACDGAGVEDGGPREPDGDAGGPDAGDVPRDAGAPDAGASGPTLAVLSLNLHCLETDGTPYATNADRFAAIAATAAAERVDVLLLQEVCDDGMTDASRALIEALGEVGAGAFVRHAVFAHVAWEGTPRQADEHVAIVARGLSRTTALVHRAQDGLQRVAAGGVVDTPLGPIGMSSVHFDHQSAPARLGQAREAAVAALVEAPELGRALIGGDVNARVGSPAHAAFGELGYVDVSGPGADRIDHVFAHRAAGLEVLEARLLFSSPAERVSDHPGVLVRFVASATPPPPWTRVSATYDPGAGRHLFLRGSVAPLSWDEGWPMHRTPDGRWRFVTSELTGTIELKTLIDDATWQTGENVRGEAGDELSVTPSF